jgi:hypothetical protein
VRIAIPIKTPATITGNVRTSFIQLTTRWKTLARATKEIFNLLRNLVHKSLPLIQTMGKMNPFHTFAYIPFKIHYIIILPHRPNAWVFLVVLHDSSPYQTLHIWLHN